MTCMFAAGIEYLTGTTVTGVDIKSKSVSTDKGQKFSYDKLMIATGSSVGNQDRLHFYFQQQQRFSSPSYFSHLFRFSAEHHT